ncbi:hypothetical protein N7465_006599 [Penicillium sp. CMV-2018d]|nr:hypothetical protein N7465_006599 [Penicillium sp. CMV-2018d]
MLANDYINTDDARKPLEEERTDSQPAWTEHRIDPLLRLKAAGVRDVADDNIRLLLDRIEDIPNVIQSLRQRAEADGGTSPPSLPPGPRQRAHRHRPAGRGHFHSKPPIPTVPQDLSDQRDGQRAAMTHSRYIATSA